MGWRQDVERRFWILRGFFLLISLSALGSVLFASPVVASAEAASLPGSLSSTPPPGIQVYEQSDVDCANPQYPEASLPFELMESGGIHSKTFYLCSSGAWVYVELFAGYLGYGGATWTELRCSSPDCADFRTLRGEGVTLWQNAPFACAHVQERFAGNVYLPPGKYSLWVFSGHSGGFFCAGRELYVQLRVDVGSPRPTVDRTLAIEDLCLANNPDPFVADPVNSRTGNFTRLEKDFAIPTRGFPLSFHRVYNSRDLSVGPLGRGWTHNWALRVMTGTVGSMEVATVLSHHGSRLRFYRQSDGSYLPEMGVRAALSRHADGTWSLRRADHVIYTFDAEGRLRSVRDRNGNTTVLHYSAGRLMAIVAPDGRSLTLTYDDTGRLVGVTDPSGRTVVYTYTPEGKLASALDPEGGLTRYGYNADGFLSVITDPSGRTITNTYDYLGRVVGQTDGLGQTTILTYTEGSTHVQDPGGHITVHFLGENGLLSRIVDPLGHTEWYTHDAHLNLIAFTDPMGRTTRWEWSPCGCAPTVITDAMGHVTRLFYDDRNNLIRVVDPAGNTTRFGYDDWNNLIAITDTLGNVTRLAYDEWGQLRSVTDATGTVTHYGYDEWGNRIVITDALGNVTRLAYDPAGRLTSIIDALGHTTVLTYDRNDRLVSVRDPLGGIFRYGYDPAGRLLDVTDPLSRTTRYEYDAAGRLITVTDAMGGRTIYDYDASGNLTRLTDPNGHVTTFAYDPAGRLIAWTDPLNHVTTFAYDPAGNLITLTDATGRHWSYSYDPLDRLREIRDALGYSIRYEYDPLGNLIRVTDPRGVATVYEYDALGRLRAVVENARPDLPADHQTNVRTEYGYDALGRRTVITDANGHVHRYEYDPLGRLITEIDPLGNPIRYGYDPLGRIVAITDAMGIATFYDYDELGRLKAIRYPEGQVTFAYDAVGNRIAMTDTTGTTFYEYDALDRLRTVTHTVLGTVAYDYDLVGNRRHVRYPDGQILTYTYDAADRLIRVTDWMGQAIRYGYDEAGRLQSVVRPNGVTTAYGYDAAGRLTQIVHSFPDGSKLLYSYTLDEAGLRTLAIEQRLFPNVLYLPLVLRDSGTGETLRASPSEPGPDLFRSPLPAPMPLPAPRPESSEPERSLAWPAGKHALVDPLSSLLGSLALAHAAWARRKKGNLAFAALLGIGLVTTAAGLRTAFLPDPFRSPASPPAFSSASWAPCVYPPPVPGGRAIRYVYDPLGRLVEAAYSTGECFQYQYDAVGNRLAARDPTGVHTFVYDAADRLIVSDGVAWTWDENGRLRSDGGRTFIYDTAGRLTGVHGDRDVGYVYSGDGLRMRQTINGQPLAFVWDITALPPQVLATSDGAIFVYGMGLVAHYRSGAWEYPVTDGLGSVRALTDGTGRIIATYAFDPFGMPLSAGGGLPYGFAGEWWDPAAGLLYLRARWYAPGTGRFLTTDPFPGFAPLPQTLHPYAYSTNNPINLTDPEGALPPLMLVAVGAVLGGVGGGIGYVLAHPGGRLETYLRSPAFWGAVGIGAVSGVAAVLVPVDGAVAGSILGRMAVGAGTAGLERVLYNMLIACAPWQEGLVEAMLAGAVSGAALGAVHYGIYRLAAHSPGAFRRFWEWGFFREIRPYKEWGTLIPRGWKKAGLEAHHLIERRFAERLGLRKSEIPAVVLDREFHWQVTGKLFGKLPTRRTYDLQTIWIKYVEAYTELGHQDWLEVIWPYFARMGVKR